MSSKFKSVMLGLIQRTGHRSTLFLSAPMLDFDSYKQTVQKVYFPLDGYTMSDFVVTNGALFTIFTDLPESALQAASIGREQAAGAASLCESNVTAVMERLSPFLEPNIRNIEAILVGVNPSTQFLTIPS